MLRLFVPAVWLLAAVHGAPLVPDTVVTTPLGQLRGIFQRSRINQVIYSFRGIRYAKPPVGSLRFQPPVAAEKWQGVVNATEDGASCPQPDRNFPLPTSEDCLFLNVYTNKLEPNPHRPVIVFFHPGGFYSGTSNSEVYGPQYLLDYDIVLVTLNYRLGALGFLSTGDGEIPGNNGLKDQVMALRWVRDNIEAFGGNPRRVTIAGDSVGAWSVIMHMVSPMSRGLFHSGIAMSGAPLPQMPITTTPVPSAQRFAALLDCPTETTRAIAECLRGKDAQDIASSFRGLLDWAFDPLAVFFPVLETNSGTSEKFLTEDPIQMLKAGRYTHVPLMIGVTKDEVSWKAMFVLQNETLTNDINTNFEHVYPIAFVYERGTERSKTISRRLKQAYFNDMPVSNETIEQLGKLYSDSTVGFATNRAAKLIAYKSSRPVYYYRFSYQGQYSNRYKPDQPNVPYGVVHMDDLLYIFQDSFRKLVIGSESPDYAVSRKMSEMWTEFVVTGNPTPWTNGWRPLTSSHSNYMDIGSSLHMKTGLYKERYHVWDQLFP